MVAINYENLTDADLVQRVLNLSQLNNGSIIHAFHHAQHAFRKHPVIVGRLGALEEAFKEGGWSGNTEDQRMKLKQLVLA